MHYNKQAKRDIVRKAKKMLGDLMGAKIAILGLAFKANTDDMREAPSTKIIPFLSDKKAKVRSYDPMAKYNPLATDNHQQFSSIEEACENADIIMAVVEWPEIISFDFSKVKNNKKQTFIDCRNQFNPERVKNWQYQYLGIGKR